MDEIKTQGQILNSLYDLARKEFKTLKRPGFREEQPDFEKLIAANGLDFELKTFLETYSWSTRTDATAWAHNAIREARETGIRDAESWSMKSLALG